MFGGIYTLLDVTNKPAALRRYKIQPGTNEPVDNRRLLKVNSAKILCIFYLNNDILGHMVCFCKPIGSRLTSFVLHVLVDAMARISCY